MQYGSVYHIRNESQRESNKQISQKQLIYEFKLQQNSQKDSPSPKKITDIKLNNYNNYKYYNATNSEQDQCQSPLKVNSYLKQLPSIRQQIDEQIKKLRVNSLQSIQSEESHLDIQARDKKELNFQIKSQIKQQFHQKFQMLGLNKSKKINNKKLSLPSTQIQSYKDTPVNKKSVKPQKFINLSSDLVKLGKIKSGNQIQINNRYKNPFKQSKIVDTEQSQTKILNQDSLSLVVINQSQNQDSHDVFNSQDFFGKNNSNRNSQSQFQRISDNDIIIQQQQQFIPIPNSESQVKRQQRSDTDKTGRQSQNSNYQSQKKQYIDQNLSQIKHLINEKIFNTSRIQELKEIQQSPNKQIYSYCKNSNEHRLERSIETPKMNYYSQKSSKQYNFEVKKGSLQNMIKSKVINYNHKALSIENLEKLYNENLLFGQKTYQHNQILIKNKIFKAKNICNKLTQRIQPENELRSIFQDIAKKTYQLQNTQTYKLFKQQGSPFKVTHIFPSLKQKILLSQFINYFGEILVQNNLLISEQILLALNINPADQFSMIDFEKFYKTQRLFYDHGDIEVVVISADDQVQLGKIGLFQCINDNLKLLTVISDDSEFIQVQKFKEIIINGDFLPFDVLHLIINPFLYNNYQYLEIETKIEHY